MRVLKTLLLILCLAVSVVAQEAPANNWSQFRGNLALTGVSQSNVPASLKQLWTWEAGESIESSAGPGRQQETYGCGLPPKKSPIGPCSVFRG